jgi:hypothetical protein
MSLRLEGLISAENILYLFQMMGFFLEAHDHEGWRKSS